MLSANKIDNMVIGGPASASGKLAKGDEIVAIGLCALVLAIGPSCSRPLHLAHAKAAVISLPLCCGRLLAAAGTRGRARVRVHGCVRAGEGIRACVGACACLHAVSVRDPASSTFAPQTDGVPFTTIEELHKLLKGSDIPGSSIIVRVRKNTTVRSRACRMY